MPSRRRGWSSTESTRIIGLSRPPAEEPKAGASRRCPVGNRAGDAQLDLRAGAGPAPDIQLRADPCGALAHSGQAVVAGGSFLYDRRVHALSIVPDAHPEQAFAIRDFRFDPAGVRVAEGIAHRLTGNPVDFVPEDRMHVP